MEITLKWCLEVYYHYLYLINLYIIKVYLISKFLGYDLYNKYQKKIIIDFFVLKSAAV